MLRRALAIPLLTAQLLLPAARAPAQEVAAPGFVRIAALSPWTDAEHPFRLRLQVTNPTELALERLSVRVEVYGRVLSRSQLRQALDGKAPTDLLAAITEDVEPSVLPGTQRTVDIERPMRALSASIRFTGVYPVKITLSHSREKITLHTAVPHVGSVPPSPLNVAVILPIARPIARSPDDTYSTASIETLASTELTQELEEIIRRPGAAVTLAPSAALLETLADLSNGFVRRDGTVPVAESDSSPAALQARALLDSIRRASSIAGELVTTPYAPVDLAGLARHGPRADVVRQLTIGRSVVERLTGRAPVPSVLVPPGFTVDASTAPALAAAGVTGSIIDPGTLPVQPSGPFEPRLFGPSRPVALRSGGARLVAALADPALRARIESKEQGVLIGQAIVAETASAWLELPLRGADRLLVVAPDRMPSPPAVAAALNGLRSAPWVRLRTVSDALRTLRPQGDELPFPRPPAPDGPWLAAARRARAALSTLSGVIVDPLPEFEELDRLVLLSESAEWRAAPAAGAALARAATARVSDVFRGLRVQSRQVTLTSRRGDLPVTITNRNGFPLRVRVALSSAKVDFPEGAQRTEELQRDVTTFDFAVEARGTGSFPIDVVIQTPDGSSTLVAGRVIVRSTAVSAVALAATAGSAVFLVFAWMRRGARRRKRAAAG